MYIFIRIISLCRWCRGNYIFISQRNEGDLFHRLWHIMNEILDLRRQVLVGHLTHDRMKDVKRHITARLDWGNEWVNISKWNVIKLWSQCFRLVVEYWNKKQISNKCYVFLNGLSPSLFLCPLCFNTEKWLIVLFCFFISV